MPNPTRPPTAIIIMHSSILKRLAVNDQIPAMAAKIKIQLKYRVLIVALLVTEVGSIPLRI